MSKINIPRPETRQPDFRQQTTKPIPFVPQSKYDKETIDELFNSVAENDFGRIFRQINEEKIPLDIRDDKNNTLLHVILLKNPSKFSERQKLDMINKLPSLISLSLIANNLRVTPLHIASQLQYSRIIPLLCNGDISQKDMNGLTPLHYAIIGHVSQCQKKRPTKIDKLQYFDEDTGAIKTDLDGSRPNEQELQYYVSNNTYGTKEQQCIKTNIDTIKVLLENGASINAMDKDNMTPFFYALKNNDLNVIQYLMGLNIVSLNEPINVFGKSPYNYFKEQYGEYIQWFSGKEPSSNKINYFTEQHFIETITESNKFSDFYRILIQTIPMKAFVMIDDQIKLLLINKLGEIVINRLYFCATRETNTSIFPIDNDKTLHSQSDVLDKKDLCERIYKPIVKKHLSKVSPYLNQWNTLITNELSKKSNLTFIEMINNSINCLINDPLDNLCSQCITNIDDTYYLLNAHINNYQYIDLDLTENYMLSYIIHIISHVIQFTLCYLLLIEILVLYKNSAPTNDINTIHDNVMSGFINEWGDKMAIDITKFTILGVKSFETGKNSVVDIIKSYLESVPNLVLSSDNKSIANERISKYANLITITCNNTKSMMDSYLDYISQGVQLSKTFIHLMKNYK